MKTDTSGKEKILQRGYGSVERCVILAMAYRSRFLISCSLADTSLGKRSSYRIERNPRVEGIMETTSVHTIERISGDGMD